MPRITKIILKKKENKGGEHPLLMSSVILALGANGQQGEHPALNQPLPRRPRWHTGGKEWLLDKGQKTKPICEKHTCL